MEILGLMGLKEEQDEVARMSKLVENFATGTVRKLDVPQSTWKYLKVPQCIEAP